MDPELNSLIERLGEILQVDFSQGEVSLQFHWGNYNEARTLLAHTTRMQKELRILRREAIAAMASIRASYALRRSQVGGGIGAAVIEGFAGRRVTSRVNAANRSGLRVEELQALKPYAQLRSFIDQFMLQLEDGKAKIEQSPEYLGKGAGEPRPTPPPKPLRFFIQLGEDIEGPFSREQLRSMRQAGRIQEDTPCCPEESENWFPYSRVT